MTKAAKKIDRALTARDYLKQPYTRMIVPEDDGTFRGEIAEFPGCIATGETAADTLSSLEDVAESWVESVIAQGQTVPAPMDISDYSGKLVLRMPRSLHRKVAFAAEREGVSLNQLIVSSVAEYFGARSAAASAAKTATLQIITNVGPFISGQATGRHAPGKLADWVTTANYGMTVNRLLNAREPKNA